MDDLCAELKQRREALGLSIDDLYTRTRINPDLLLALEEGRFDVLPETYVRLFLRKYAQEVGADGSEIIRAYDLHNLRLKRETTAEPKRIEPPPGRVTASPGKRVAIAAVLIVVAVTVGALLRGGPEPDPPQAIADRAPSVTATPVPVRTSPPVARAERSPEPASPASAPLASRIPEPEPEVASASEAEAPPAAERVPESETERETGDETEAAPTFDATMADDSETGPSARPAPPAAQPPPSSVPDVPVEDRVVNAFSLSPERIFSPADSTLALTLRGLDNTVATITADGELLYQGPILAGRRTTWTARNRFRLEVRTGSAVEIALQGRPLRALGRSGEQIRLFISRSSIWVEEIEPESRAGALQ